MLSFVLLIISTTVIFPNIKCLAESQRPPLSHNTTIKDTHIVGDEYKKLSTLRYTKHAVSNISGDHCITDCVNDYCLTEKERVETCQVDERRRFETPLIYYTSYTNDVYICLSKCTAGDKGHYWCYIGNKYEIDYCNPFTDHKLVAGFFDAGKEILDDPCEDKCKKQGKTHEWCNLTLQKKTIDCHPDEPVYYQYHKESSQLNECVGVCGQWPKNTLKSVPEKLKQKQFYWCSVNDKNLGWNFCAQPAEEFSFCKQCGKVDIQQYIKNVEHDSKNERVSLNDSSTSIISYTYRKLPDGVRLPLVVKAIIWLKHIRDQDVIRNKVDDDTKKNCMEMEKTYSDCRKYVFGNLVAYELGGTGDKYNVVPLSKHLYVGTQDGDYITPSLWHINQRKIINYVHNFNGVIELTIAVYYNDKNHINMPTAIGTSMRVLDRQVTASLWHCENLHSNVPNASQECLLENELSQIDIDTDKNV